MRHSEPALADPHNGDTAVAEPGTLGGRSLTKGPKANLKELVRAGLLRNGEKVFLVNYQGNCAGQFEATVSGRYLTFRGENHSMSSLACDLLKEVGFTSNSVRGPAHWVNARDVSIQELWRQLIDRQR